MRNDSGATHVLEAVLVTMCLLGGVIFVVTFNYPTVPNAKPAARLETETSDILGLLAEKEIDAPQYGNRTLSKLIAEALQGNTGNLTAEMQKLLAPGVRYNLYISNGYGEPFPIYESYVPSGETVSSVRPFDPRWSYVFLTTDMDNYDAASDIPMSVYAVPLYNGNVVEAGGAPVGVLATGSKENGGSFSLSAYSSTVQSAATGANTVGHVSLYYRDPSTLEKRGILDVTAQTQLSPGIPSLVEVPFTAVINETEGKTVPEETVITVRIPPGWSATAYASDNPAWTVTKNATDWNVTGEIKAVLNNGFASQERTFTYNAVYHGGKTQFYPFITSLSGGTVNARSELVVLADDVPGVGEVEQVFITAPNPMGHSGEGTWTIVLTNPLTEITLRSLELHQPDGIPIFGTVTQVSGPSGTWLTTNGETPSTANATSTLVWTGTEHLDASTGGKYAEFVLKIGATATATPTQTDSPLTLPLTFDNGGPSGSLGRQIIAPGIYTENVYPTNATRTREGYDWTTSQAGDVPHTYSSSSDYRLQRLFGEAGYRVAPLTSYKDVFAGGHITPSARTVPIGQTVDLNIDLSSLFLQLSQANQATQVAAKIYPPWSGLTRIPMVEKVLNESYLLDGSVTAIALQELSNDTTKDIVVGTSNGNVYVFNGTNGFKLPQVSYRVDSTDAAQVAGVTALGRIRLADGTLGWIVGTNEKSSKLYVVDARLNTQWTFSKSLTNTTLGVQGLNVSSVTGEHDLNNDNVADLVFTQSDGLVYAVSGKAPHTVLDGWPVLTGASAGLVLPGTFGYEAGRGVVSTVDAHTYLSAPVTQPRALNNTYTTNCLDETGQMDRDATLTCTRETSSDLLPDASVQPPLAGLYGFSALGAQLWNYLGTAANVVAVTHLNPSGDSVSDVVLGDNHGYVIGLNGTMAAPFSMGTALLGGAPFQDSQFVDADHGYMMTYTGIFYYTDDSFASTMVVRESVGGTPPTTRVVVGARGLGMIDQNLGFVVGDAGKIWRFWSLDITTSPGRITEVIPILTFSHHPSMGTIKGKHIEDPDRALYNLTDVAFVDRDVGFITSMATSASICALEPANALCGAPAIFNTSDGGASWTLNPVPSGVNGHLHRIFFPTLANGEKSTTGYAVGDNGIVLRITDAGSPEMNITKVPTPTTITLRGLHFWDNLTGIVVGDGGTVLKTTDGGATWAAMPVPTTVTLYDVSFQGPEVGVISGGLSTILRTWNGGDDWVDLQGMQEPEMTALDYRSVAFPAPDVLHVIGGGIDRASYVTLGAHRMSGNVGVLDLKEDFADASEIFAVILLTNGRENDELDGRYQISFDNGTTWHAFNRSYDYPDRAPDNRRKDIWQPIVFGSPGLVPGDDANLKVRVYLNNTGEYGPRYIPMLKNLTLSIHYLNKTGAPAQYYRHINFKGESLLTPDSTLEWNSTLGTLRAKSVPQFWVYNANGAAVRSMNVSVDFNGDDINDVVVGTGAQYVNPLVPASGIIGYDNRIYILDGRTGGLLWRSDSLPGEVLQVAIANLTATTGDSVPDVVATYWNGSMAYGAGSRGGTAVFDTTGSTGPIGAGFTFDQSPTALIAGRFDPSHPEDRYAFGTASNRTNAREGKGGMVYTFAGDHTKPRWRTPLDEVGKFTTAWTVSRGSLFGAYIVEAEVKWAPMAASPELQDWSASNVQTARVINYVTVTPPNGRIPKTPLYNVQLVAWYEDWN